MKYFNKTIFTSIITIQSSLTDAIAAICIFITKQFCHKFSMYCKNKTLLFLLTYKHIIEHKTRDVFVRNTLSPYCAALIHVFFTFDLEGWPWPFTTQNVQLNEIHMHTKYQVAMWRGIEFMSIFWNLNAKPKRKVWRKDVQSDHYMPSFGDIKIKH